MKDFLKIQVSGNNVSFALILALFTLRLFSTKNVGWTLLPPPAAPPDLASCPPCSAPLCPPCQFGVGWCVRTGGTLQLPVLGNLLSPALSLQTRDSGTFSRYSVFQATFRAIQQWVYSLISLKIEISEIKMGFLL